MIAAAFTGSVPLGVATALAALTHEVPQELGDLAILLDAGWSRTRALLANGLSSLATIAGAALAYVALDALGA